jgi:rhodanese-related sulfurtransferase
MPDPWTAADLIEPAQLAPRLKGPPAARPIVYYVGFGVLYRSKHIPGAEFVGPASKQEGLQALREAALKHPRSQEIVIYCGCCPWDNCPNMRPAFQTLKEMGFVNLKALDIPERLGDDWTAKGFPIVKGE